MGIHHVAYATRDIAATVHFYEDLFGFPLVHTEHDEQRSENGTHAMSHIFFDAGDGASIAFFALENVGEAPDWKSDLSDAVGLPVWVNHCAFRVTETQQEEVKGRMHADGIEPLMEVDHGWCHSVYFVDPNGIMVELCRDTPGLTPDPAEAKRLLGLPAARTADSVAGGDR